MKILNVTLKSFHELPDVRRNEGIQGSNPQGKRSLAQRHIWEVERLLEGGIKPSENSIN